MSFSSLKETTMLLALFALCTLCILLDLGAPAYASEVSVCTRTELTNAIEQGIKKIVVTCDQAIEPQLEFAPTVDMIIEGSCTGGVACKMAALKLSGYSDCTPENDDCHWSLTMRNLIFDGDSTAYGSDILWKTDDSNSIPDNQFTGSVSFESCTFQNLLDPMTISTRFDTKFQNCAFKDNVGKAWTQNSIGGTVYNPGMGGAFKVVRSEVVVHGCTFENNDCENSMTGLPGQGKDVWIGAPSFYSAWRPKVYFSGTNSIHSTSPSIYIKVDQYNNNQPLGSAVDVSAPPPAPPPPAPAQISVCTRTELTTAIEQGIKKIVVTCHMPIKPRIEFAPTVNVTIVAGMEEAVREMMGIMGAYPGG